MASRAQGQLCWVGSVVRLADGKPPFEDAVSDRTAKILGAYPIGTLDFEGLEPRWEAQLEVKPRP